MERRREISTALVYPFMRSVMEAPFPAPGRTVTVKSFLPGSGNEVTLNLKEEMLISSFVPSNHLFLQPQNESEWEAVSVNNKGKLVQLRKVSVRTAVYILTIINTVITFYRTNIMTFAIKSIEESLLSPVSTVCS